MLKHRPAVPRAVALLLGALVAGPPAAAQTCFRGEPLPDCRSFFLTEASAGVFYGVSYPFTADLGYMRNLDPRSAVGGSLFLSTDWKGVEASSVAFGLRPRYRRWLSRQTSLDATLALGGVVVETSRSVESGVHALAALSFGAWDLLGVTAGIGFSSADDSELHWLLGVRIGSWIGSPLILVGLVAAAVGG